MSFVEPAGASNVVRLSYVVCGACWSVERRPVVLCRLWSLLERRTSSSCLVYFVELAGASNVVQLSYVVCGACWSVECRPVVLCRLWSLLERRMSSGCLM